MSLFDSALEKLHQQLNILCDDLDETEVKEGDEYYEQARVAHAALIQRISELDRVEGIDYSSVGVFIDSDYADEYFQMRSGVWDLKQRVEKMLKINM